MSLSRRCGERCESDGAVRAPLRCLMAPCFGEAFRYMLMLSLSRCFVERLYARLVADLRYFTSMPDYLDNFSYG